MSNYLITPFLELAINNFSHFGFFHLYPFLFYIRVDTHNGIRIGVNTITWRTIPWILSMTLITGFLGFGSLVYLCLLGLTQSNNEIQFYKYIIFFSAIICSFSEMLASMMLYRYKVIIQAIYALFQLETKSKQKHD